MFRFKRAFNLQLIKKYFSFALNALFPVHCSCCRVPLKASATPPYICKECFKSVHLIKNNYCTNCGRLLDITPNSLICPVCATDTKLPFKEFVAPLTYSEIGRAMVHNLKFHKTPSAAETIGELIYIKLTSTGLIDNIDAFIPAPISKERLYQRSYNQTELICKYLSKKSGKPTIKGLSKIKHTPAQSTLNSKERLTNLDNSIIFNKKAVLPQKVAFVDDVYTTGTTAGICCNILKKNGAKSIYVICACINSKDTYE